MATSFATFLRTGQFGPLTLGMDPSAVELQLGPPDARSRKHNPLLMKYGPLELTFWSPRSSQALQLVQFLLSVVMNDFSRFVEQIGASPEEILTGDRESSIVLPSGVKASFIDNQLSALLLSRRERDESRPPILTD